jgi:hypothetical protein
MGEAWEAIPDQYGGCLCLDGAVIALSTAAADPLIAA